MTAGGNDRTLGISIHAPREGSDPHSRDKEAGRSDFYPRSPRGERLVIRRCHREQWDFYPRSPRGERLRVILNPVGNLLFLSTLPARGATFDIPGYDDELLFLSTLPARGATREPYTEDLSIGFLSTLPARGATCYAFSRLSFWPISIHAPREGSDK